MRVRVWNAFASNNSGSYSIVGSFPSPEVAEAVAAELLPVVRAHSEWALTGSDEWRPNAAGPFSPLGRWATEHGLQWGGDAEEEWPFEGVGLDVPDVIAVGSDVLVHEDYTISLPRVFGEYFYRRGGRVTVELNHAHHPLVVAILFFVPWNDPAYEELEYRLLEARESLESRRSPLRKLLAPGTDLVVRERPVGNYQFEIAAVFSDLIAGVAAARDLARNAGVSLVLSLKEAWGAVGDPLEPIRVAWDQDPYW